MELLSADKEEPGGNSGDKFDTMNESSILSRQKVLVRSKSYSFLSKDFEGGLVDGEEMRGYLENEWNYQRNWNLSRNLLF